MTILLNFYPQSEHSYKFSPVWICLRSIRLLFVLNFLWTCDKKTGLVFTRPLLIKNHSICFNICHQQIICIEWLEQGMHNILEVTSSYMNDHVISSVMHQDVTCGVSRTNKHFWKKMTYINKRVHIYNIKKSSQQSQRVHLKHVKSLFLWT